MTHYKWYDYKHVHTTYIKQLSNNTKQTDKTKRSRKKKQTRTKGKEKKTKRQEQKPAPTHPPPTATPQKKEKKKATKYSRCRRHTSDTYKSKHSHIWLNTHYGEGRRGGGGILTPSSLLLSRHQNKGREYTMEITHSFEITFKL